MSQTWQGDAAPPGSAPRDFRAWLRIVRRGGSTITVLVTLFCVMQAVRVVESRVFVAARPWTMGIRRAACAISVRTLGLGLNRIGSPMNGQGAMVANHVSWLDILALNACDRVVFVSKDEVARWPAIGLLARAAGTVFIVRDPRAAKEQRNVFETRLKRGERLLFFPEGTSTDGLRVLPFKTSLFAAFYAPGLRDSVSVQPVTLRYRAPPGEDPRIYSWWGEMALGPHLLDVLARKHHGSVDVVFHDPVTVAAVADRKALAARLEASARGGLALSEETAANRPLSESCQPSVDVHFVTEKTP